MLRSLKHAVITDSPNYARLLTCKRKKRRGNVAEVTGKRSEKMQHDTNESDRVAHIKEQK